MFQPSFPTAHVRSRKANLAAGLGVKGLGLRMRRSIGFLGLLALGCLGLRALLPASGLKV